MPRRHRRVPSAPPTAAARSLSEREETYRGTQYRVRSLRGDGGGGGPYRCPGCDQLVPPGIAHIVAWPAHDIEASDRRHWHTVCWSNRATRSPTSRPR